MRPDIHNLLGVATLGDESYLDFVEGLRAFNLSRMVQRMAQAADALGKTMANATPTEHFHALGEVSAAQLAHRMISSTQMMMWRGTGNTYGAMPDEMENWLIGA